MFRTDYQAFGETIESGIGLRTTAQGFGSPASNRYRGRLSEADFSMGERLRTGTADRNTWRGNSFLFEVSFFVEEKTP